MISKTMGAWYRFADGTVTGQGYSSVPDVLGGPSLEQSVDARRPARVLSNNGLPCASFVDDVLAATLDPSSTALPSVAGVAAWIRFDDVAVAQHLLAIVAVAGGASLNRLRCYKIADDLAFDLYPPTLGAPARQLRSDLSRPVLAKGVWTFCYWDFSADAGPSESDRARLWVNASPCTNCVLSGASTVPTVLAQPTGKLLLGARSTAPTNPFTGLVGPNLWLPKARLSPTQQLALSEIEMPL